MNDQLTSNIACIWENFLMSGGSLSTGVQSSKVQRQRALLQVPYKQIKIFTYLVDLYPVKLCFSCWLAYLQGLAVSPVYRCFECSTRCGKVRFKDLTLMPSTKGSSPFRNSFQSCNIVTNLIRYEEQYPAFGDSREAKLIKVFILCQSKKRQCSRKSSPTNNLLFVIILTGEKFADC